MKSRIGTPVVAGFASVAEQYIERPLDLNALLVKHPVGTFFLRVDTDSMIDAGISPNDILIVDRTLSPTDGMIVVAEFNQEFIVRYYKQTQTTITLEASKNKNSKLTFSSDDELVIFGVVTASIHPFTQVDL